MSHTPSGIIRPLPELTFYLYDSSNVNLLGVLHDVVGEPGSLRLRTGSGATSRLDLRLSRLAGHTTLWPNDPWTDSSLAIGNYVRIYYSDAHTLSNTQSDEAASRDGSNAGNLSRLLWQGAIRSIRWNPHGSRFTITAVSAAGTEASPAVAHIIPAEAVIGGDLELSNYRDSATVDFTATLEIANDAYDTAGIVIGDTVQFLERRVLNLDSTTRYNDYSAQTLTVKTVEWGLRSTVITTDERDPHLVDDQLFKLRPLKSDDDKNLYFNQDTANDGSGAGVIAIANASTSPTTTPATGGVLWSEAGALTWRGSGGTVTVIAPA